ncbi:MAG: Xaa-Pro peptidase family protein [Pseudomonadota bacterium]
MAEGFPEAEFRDRLERLQGHMGDLDALLLTSPADIFWITGFLTRFWESPARPWFVLVPRAGDPGAVIPSIGAALMGATWLRDVRTWDAPDPDDDGVSLLAEAVRELVPASGALGVPMGLETALRMPLADYERLREAIAPRAIQDGTQAIQRAREVKSDAEVDKIRGTCALAGRAFDAAPGFATPGRGLDAVFRDFQAALLREGADWVSYVAGAAGPAGYDDVIAPAGPQKLAAGDVLMLDTGAVRDGYFCDFDRNIAIGPVAPRVADVHRALWDVTENALEALRPGMTAADVHALMASGLEAGGCTPCPGRLGHGLGVTLTEWPSFTPKDQTVLRAGMVLTLEPSAFTEGGHFLTHEENIVLRAGGPELLSPRAPREMVQA